MKWATNFIQNNSISNLETFGLPNITFKVKTVVATFWATIGQNWAIFYSNIWSHCALNPSVPLQTPLGRSEVHRSCFYLS